MTTLKATLAADIPPPTHSAPRVKYPFHLLEKTGQCLTFPPETDYRKLSRAAHQYAMRHDWFAAVRRIADGSIRVWRVE